MIQAIQEAVRNGIHEAVKESVTNATTSLLTAVIGASQAIALIGGTISIILYVAGWKDGMRWSGMIFVGYVILRAVLGGM